MMMSNGILQAKKELSIKQPIVARLTGTNEDKAMEILKAQIPIDEKKRMADYIIQNEYTLDKTEKEVKDLWKKLKEITHSHRRAKS